MKIGGIDMSDMLLSIATQLAHLDDESQAEFFNVFADELAHCCKTNYNFGMQGAFVAKSSNEKFEEFCSHVSYDESDEVNV